MIVVTGVESPQIYGRPADGEDAVQPEAPAQGEDIDFVD